jgi:hypothetical protein
MRSIKIVGYLAYFDLLGFSELIKKTEFNKKFSIFCARARISLRSSTTKDR